MIGLFDLPNELLLAISSHVTKPSSMLHLALTNKHAYAKFLPILYEILTFDHRDYDEKIEEPEVASSGTSAKSFNSTLGAPSWNPSNSTPLQSEPPNPKAPFTNIIRLARMLEFNSLALGQNVTALTLSFSTNNEGNFSQIAFAKLIPLLTSLRHLVLIASGDGLRQHTNFSYAPLAGALRPLSGILRSLSIFVSRVQSSGDGWTIGSMSHFVALEELSIQVHGLLGLHEDEIANADLMDILPSRLKHLQIRSLHVLDLQPLAGTLAWYVERLQLPQWLERITLHIHVDIVGRDIGSRIVSLGNSETDLEWARDQAMQRGVAIDWYAGVNRDYL